MCIAGIAHEFAFILNDLHVFVGISKNYVLDCNICIAHIHKPFMYSLGLGVVCISGIAESMQIRYVLQVSTVIKCIVCIVQPEQARRIAGIEYIRYISSINSMY